MFSQNNYPVPVLVNTLKNHTPVKLDCNIVYFIQKNMLCKTYHIDQLETYFTIIVGLLLIKDFFPF